MKTGPIVGSELAGYRVEGVVGRGGMSIVYLAEHLRLGRKVALKILAPELAEDDGFRERFVRESRIAASLDHPNVIPIFDAGEENGLLYITMRYVDGTDLRQLIEDEGRLRPRWAHGIVAQVAGALDAAHSRGLIHRDVKPGNVLIDPEVDTNEINHVYLTDFGLVKQTISNPALTRPGQFVGTIPYVSPEQIQGKSVDRRADIYSLGCVLFECLTGQQPYPRDDDVAVMWAHVNDDRPRATALRPELASQIDEVLAKAMAKSPEERYQTCREFAAAASRVLRVSGDFEVLHPVTPPDGSPVALATPTAAETAPGAAAFPGEEIVAPVSTGDADGKHDAPSESVGVGVSTIDTTSSATPADSETHRDSDTQSDSATTTLREPDDVPAGPIPAATLAASTVTVDVGDAVTVQDARVAAETVAAEDRRANGHASISAPTVPEAPTTPTPPSREGSRRGPLLIIGIIAVLLIGVAAVAVPMLAGDSRDEPALTGGPNGGAGQGGGTLAAITSFKPVSGPVDTEVTITGTGFAELTGVEFNGEPASFVVVSDMEVTATVPARATTGPISVSTPNGTVQSEGKFVVIEPVGAPRAVRTLERSTNRVVLAWKRASGGGRPEYFVVYRDEEVYAKRVEERTFTDREVRPGETYVYVVEAIGVDGSAERSKPLELTIPFPAPSPTSGDGGGSSGGSSGGGGTETCDGIVIGDDCVQG